MMELLSSPDLGPVAQTLLGLATLINSMFLWPVVKSLKANDATHDERLRKLESKKTRKRRPK